MPEADGIEVIRALRQSNPDIKVIAISRGRTTFGKQYLREAAVFGATATIEKPFSLVDFLELVKTVEQQPAAHPGAP